jgi:GR25 family glycosyltransferase involved in LPS biosynthesis
MTKSYIIHLKTSTEREELVAGLLDALPDGRVLDAVDGRVMSEAERAAFMQGRQMLPRYPFALSPSEVGCFLSHKKAWDRIAAGDEPYAVVAEDDIMPGPEFDSALQLACANATEDSLIRFPIRNRERPGRVIAEDGGLCLFRPEQIGLTTGMYLLGREAARKLSERSGTIDRPVDTWLQMRWETGVDSWAIWPSRISSAAESHGGSTIQSKRSRLSQITRTWHRARYRAAISRRSARS